MGSKIIKKLKAIR